MADTKDKDGAVADPQESGSEKTLQGGAYEVLRQRLESQDRELCSRLDKLNAKRKEVFGGHDSQLTGNERVQTENNCVPRDIIGVQDYLLFGYNVYIGLKSETTVRDVFNAYKFDGTEFKETEIDILQDPTFVRDFQELYKYYKSTRFLQFIKTQSKLLLVFQVGKTTDDVKIMRFKVNRDESLSYVDDRGDMEYKLPPQHEFEWIATVRDDQVVGMHPHISIRDTVFVECIEGDLTIKVENNTETGEGIYSEPVESPDQTLDDAEINYAFVGDLILLRIRPYREECDRHFVFNQKTRSVVRIDSMAQACILLPEDHGIIFPKGYYLRDGAVRQFEEDVAGMIYLECIRSPNGEDFLYVFYHVVQGRHILMQYNLITKQLANPIFCHGYSLYQDGKMVLFYAPNDEPKRVYTMQIWETPFYNDAFEVPQQTDSYLNKIGNCDLVRGISECYAVSRLITAPKTTLFTYQDLIQDCANLIDGYHWLDQEEIFNIKEVVQAIREAGVAAVDEYEKVVAIRENTEQQIAENAEAVKRMLIDYTPDHMGSINDFVNALGDLRTRRGQVISLRELRYADVPVIESMDERLGKGIEEISIACVDFLLRDDALVPYVKHNEEIADGLKNLEKVADVIPKHEELEELAGRLDLLTDVINNLDIEDATKTTRIVDNITDVYAGVNRTRAEIRNLRKDLGKGEAKAEFAAQYKLLTQSITNYIGMCDTVEKCDEYLTKLMVSIEELEGRFADFEEYIEQLTEKREEAYAAFTGRKQVLDEVKSRRVGGLVSSADRILKSVASRAETLKSVDEVNGYFASDLMVAKLRDIIRKLHDSGDSVKADDITGRVKSAKDGIVRRLRDKLDLFEEGENIIRFGDYKFTVNTQSLELTTVLRGNDMFFHLTGTDFYEQITDEDFLSTRSLWQQEMVSESRDVYRGEYLAYQMLMAAVNRAKGLSLDKLTAKDVDLVELVREFSSDLYDEGYEKGVHDSDAALILESLVVLYQDCLLLRYDSESRAHAIIFWCFYENEAHKNILRSRMRSFGKMRRVFGQDEINDAYVAEIREAMVAFFERLDRPVAPAVLSIASEYLYYELQDEVELEFTINALAEEIHDRFEQHLRENNVHKSLQEAIAKLEGDVKSRLNLILDWVSNYVNSQEDEDAQPFIWEVVALIAAGRVINRDTTSVSTFRTVDDLLGQHSLIQDKTLEIHFDRFLLKMTDFSVHRVPMFRKYTALRKRLTEERRADMRLSEFESKVMGSFVRNKLINDVYLNMVGANFAKQMGVAGESKRTDLMGLLLLISPPGYGKTTLMEYISNRLGLTFMKVNGPAIGHQVTSLDPAEAPNATAKEELNKLNLSLEMGNNVMIYLDDIQHLNPELLQKFISLCDAQRKIEGVYRGVTKTYDLRGKKVAVVMAGNPYTESGDKFKIPDMLANRADTYNLGDITSTSADAFAMSFIENAMTSNPVLSKIASHGHEDIYRFQEIAERDSREGVELQGNYSSAETDEIVTVLKKLGKIRDVVLRVNQQYISSAAQQDEYRTEPAFKLQGSYRNMNRLAEKVFPVMTDDEVDNLVLDHYYNESQTLTTGAEANILKFKEMMAVQSQDEEDRWDKIKGEFNRRQSLSGIDDSDEIGKILAQLSGFNANMGQIRTALEKGVPRGLEGIAAAMAKVSEAKTGPDLAPLIEAIKGMETGSATDLKPVVEAIKGATAKQKKQDKLEVVSTFPKEYADAWGRQVAISEEMAMAVSGMKQQGEVFARLEHVLEKLVNGEMSIELNALKK